MTTRTAARRPKAGAPGFKALATAVSLAVTLGGWAVMAANTQPAGQAATSALPPMPTLVPTPAPFVAQINSGPSTTASTTAPAANSQTNNLAVRPHAITINPNLLPGPVAVTRSSR